MKKKVFRFAGQHMKRGKNTRAGTQLGGKYDEKKKQVGQKKSARKRLVR